jgi:hypothetical protein
MIVNFPATVFAAAEKRMGVLEPAAVLKGLLGLETTPGKAVRVTWPQPVKPLPGSTDRVTAGLVVPCWAVAEFEEKPMEKSGCRGGDPGGF